MHGLLQSFQSTFLHLKTCQTQNNILATQNYANLQNYNNKEEQLYLYCLLLTFKSGVVFLLVFQ